MDLASLIPLLLVVHVTLAVSLLLPAFALPFALRTRGRDGEPVVAAGQGRATRALLWLEAHGTLLVGAGVALSGIGLLVAMGGAFLDQPWLLAALGLYSLVLAAGIFIQRPGLTRLFGLRVDATEAEKERWRVRARRQRYVSYLMALGIGIIGWLMMAKPALVAG